MKEANSELSSVSSVPPVPAVASSSEEQGELRSDPSSPACVTRTCSLPRQKRMGDCASPSQANVAVVSPMPHMTKVGGGQARARLYGEIYLSTLRARV